MVNKYSFLQTASTIVTKVNLFLGFDATPYISSFDNVEDYYLSYATVGGNGIINDFQPYYDSFLERKNNNNFAVTTKSGYITGYTIVQKLNRQLTDEEKNSFPTKFIEKSNLNYSGGTIKFGVKFDDVPKDDMYINISMEREIDFLDTLSIKNNLKGEWTKKTSDTGVIFGKLLAIQKLKDENGEFIKIPLRGVPIIVLNKAENVSAINLTDDNNARIPLNMQQNSPRELYFDDFSYNFDKGILPSVNTKNSGEKYRYSTLTNEKGEFLLTDVPVGVQTVIFEVDLLKQGLSTEEVELNVAPFPKTNEISVIEAPHLIYREIPVNVLNSWGDTLNVGYTRLNIDINVDLRKWTTYFVPPITLFNKQYDELLQQGYQPNLRIKVRDMANRSKDTNALFPNTKIECVVVDDVKKRDFTRLLGWTNEFRQLRDSIIFFNLEYNVFKLPANIYDPDGYKRNGDGSLKTNFAQKPNQKGVWLSSYEMRVFTTQEDIVYRDTGFLLPELKSIKMGRNIDLPKSLYMLNTNVQNLTGQTQQGIGTYPFEKAWTSTYPTPYSIPEIPKILNTSKTYQNGIPDNLLVPRYLDGDVVGLSDDSTVTRDGYNYGGWGAQINFADSIFANKFAQQVTTSKLYRYEINGSFGEEYSNGYSPNNNNGNIPDAQKSIVLNGEQYQRLEAGHAYFIWTQGFPRIWNKQSHDEMLPSDFLSSYIDNDKPKNVATNLNALPYYQTYKIINSLLLNDTLVASNFDNSAYITYPENTIGYSYFYRVVDPDPTKLVPAGPPFIPKYIKINFDGQVYVQRGGRDLVVKLLRSNANIEEKYQFYELFNAKQATKDSLSLTIYNKGILTVSINKPDGTSVSIEKDKSAKFNLFDIYNTGLELPTNDSFDSEKNTYNTVNYEFSFDDIKFYFPNGNNTYNIGSITKNGGGKSQEYFKPLVGISGETKASGEVPQFYMVTNVSNVFARGPAGKFKPDGLIVNCKVTADVNGAAFICSRNSFVNNYEFRTSKASTDAQKGDDLSYHVLDITG